MTDPATDVFISYRHRDASQVHSLAEALQAAGVRVWIDDIRIEDFQSIQRSIENGLARSKALLAWYSADYPNSRACQWELATAFLAAQQAGDIRQRVFAVNPEDSNTHIYPIELRDALYRSAPAAGHDLQSLVDVISLLTHRRRPKDEQETSEAASLASDLGYHALALELAAGVVERRGYTEVRRRLADRSKDVLDFAADLFGAGGGTLPHRDAVDINISRTLLITIEPLNSGMDVLRLAAQLAPAPISRELVAGAFAAADGLSRADAEDIADLAVAEALSHSLARATLETAVVVHTLVSRTVRFRDPSPDRQRTLRRAACEALAAIIQPSRSWAGTLASDVTHARVLISSMLEAGAGLNMDDARSLVAVLQQIYPYTVEGGSFWQRALEICREVLGDQDPSTLIAMNRRALWLYSFGDADEALDAQEQVFELSRSIRGEQHIDTEIALQNLWETVGDRQHQFKSHDAKPYQARLRALRQKRQSRGPSTGPATLMNNPV